MQDKLYKVVHKKTRKGSNWCLMAKRNLPETIDKAIKKADMQDYFPTYKKGATIKKVPKTGGLFCFITKPEAELFIAVNKLDQMCKVIEVRPVKRVCKTITFILGAGIISNLLKLKRDKSGRIAKNVKRENRKRLHGWVTVDEVEVLT